MKPLFISLGLILLTNSAAASSVYRCDINGEVIFSQQPCATNAKEIQLKYTRRDEESAQRLQEEHEATSLRGADLARERRTREVQHRIDEENRAINRLQRERDAELAMLRQKQGTASNNLAGAHYEQSINTEMQAVNQRYDSRISTRQTNIERLRSDMQQLRE